MGWYEDQSNFFGWLPYYGPWLHGTAVWARDKAQDAWDYIWDSLIPWLNSIADSVQSMWNWIERTGKKVIEWINQVIKPVWDFVWSVVTATVNSVLAEIDKIFTWISNFTHWVETKIFKPLLDVIEYISTCVNQTLLELLIEVANLWYYALSLYDHFTLALLLLTAEVKVRLSDLWNNFLAELKSFAESIDAKFTMVISWTQEQLKNLYDAVIDYIKEIVDWVEEEIDSIKAELDNIHSFLEEAFEDSWTLAENAVIGTFAKYGALAVRELIFPLLSVVTPEEAEYIETLDVGEIFNQQVENIASGPEGSWRDVEAILQALSDSVEANENPPPLGLDYSLLPASEQKAIAESQATLDEFFRIA